MNQEAMTKIFVVKIHDNGLVEIEINDSKDYVVKVIAFALTDNIEFRRVIERAIRISEKERKKNDKDIERNIYDELLRDFDINFSKN